MALAMSSQQSTHLHSPPYQPQTAAAAAAAAAGTAGKLSTAVVSLFQPGPCVSLAAAPPGMWHWQQAASNPQTCSCAP
jgi:hypothetical protein